MMLLSTLPCFAQRNEFNDRTVLESIPRSAVVAPDPGSSPRVGVRFAIGSRYPEEVPVTRARNRELLTLVDHFAAGELSRRDFARRLGALGGGAVFGGALGTALARRSALAGAAGGGRPGVARFQDDPPPVAGGTVVAATIDKPVNMDPAFAQLYSSMQVYQNIFNKLVYVDANYNYIPGLAKSWTQVDPITWEFDLV